MRHRKHKNTLGLVTAHRKAVLMNLAIALIENNRIKTTLTKAKAVSPFVDKLVTLAKKGDLASQRKIFSYLRSRDLVKKMVSEIGPRFKDREGGYTRILKYKNRVGDGALQAFLEFTEIPVVEEKEKPVAKGKKVPKKADEKDEEKKEGIIGKVKKRLKK